MRLIDLDEFLRQNCVDRMGGKSCEECKHHVLEVSCERLMEQPTIDPVKVIEEYCKPRNLMLVAAEDFKKFVPVKRGVWVMDGNPQRGGEEKKMIPIKIERREPVMKWIPVSERLPKNDDWVIITILDERGDTPFRYTDFGWYLEAANCWIVEAEQRTDVTAWMPLPKPWRGEDDGD